MHDGNQTVAANGEPMQILGLPVPTAQLRFLAINFVALVCRICIAGEWTPYGVRFDRRLWQDLKIFIAVTAWTIRSRIREYLHDGSIFALSIFGNLSASTYTAIATGLTFVTYHYIFQSHLHRHSLTAKHPAEEPSMNPKASFLPALLFPCKTTHARIFPKKHSFAYSYLFVGISVDFQGCEGGMVSMDGGKGKGKGRGRKGWFDVRAEDYLARGGGELGLRGKLEAYLENEDVRKDEWTHAYLVTAPRFLGYSFNPVSFWYIYDSRRILKFTILEVNNTFDERRMYLLRAADETTEDESTQGLDPTHDANGQRKRTTTRRFTNAWTKDFHVSPFNSRKGTYHLSAVNPFPTFSPSPFPSSSPSPSTSSSSQSSSSSPPLIDNTITLRSSHAHSKLVARVFSTSPSISPLSLSTFQKLQFILAWCWVGFVTFPRILREAGKLFVKRRLWVWYRPEVGRGSLGRMPTEVERFLSGVILQYLHFLARQSRDIGYFTTHSNLPDSLPHTTESALCEHEACPGMQPCINPITITISTPAFYSAFINYTSTSEALRKLLLPSNPLNRHGSIEPSSAEVIDKLVSHQRNFESVRPVGLCDGVRWKFLALLRPNSPPVFAYPDDPAMKPEYLALCNTSSPPDPVSAASTSTASSSTSPPESTASSPPSSNPSSRTSPPSTPEPGREMLDPLSGRTPPPPMQHNAGTSSSAHHTAISGACFSDVDECVLRELPASERSAYRRMVTKVFLAQRMGVAGFEGVVEGIDLLLRVGLTYIAIQYGLTWAGLLIHVIEVAKG